MLMMPVVKPPAIHDSQSIKQLEFAENYFSICEYEKAIVEYERFIFFFPNDSRISRARYQIGMAYFHLRHFEKARDAFSAVIENSIDGVSGNAADSWLMIGECYANQNAFSQALQNFQNLILLTKNPVLIDEARYRIAWIYIKLKVLQQARIFLEMIENKEKYRINALLKELENPIHIPQKNPIMAGVLSIIPGAGALYCGRYRDAATAFIINGLLMAAAYEAFDDENYALGGLISIVEFGFYTGSIYGAVSSAHKYNIRQNEQFIERLKQNARIDLSCSKNGVILSFQYDF